MTHGMQTTRFRFWLWLIALVGVIVPRQLRRLAATRWLKSLLFGLQSLGICLSAALQCRPRGSGFFSNISAFSAFFSDKSAFPDSRVTAAVRKHFRSCKLVNGPPFASWLVEVTRMLKVEQISDKERT